jgi:ribosome recycling factor
MDENLTLILSDAEDKMLKCMEHLSGDLHTVRAGRATPSMLDAVKVEAYGSMMPLNQMANVSAPQADLLVVQPWDKSSLRDIEQAIIAANLGLNPSNDGTMIRLPVPTLTEERRRELAKSARNYGEEAKVAVRNVRRAGRDDIKDIVAAENLSEDFKFEAEDALQKMTDKFIGQIDALLDRKEAEIMKV